jgi:hypothetical protein
MALGFGLLVWITLLFSPLAFVQTVKAADEVDYGTVIGIVSCRSLNASLRTHELTDDRIWEPHTPASV